MLFMFTQAHEIENCILRLKIELGISSKTEVIKRVYATRFYLDISLTITPFFSLSLCVCRSLPRSSNESIHFRHFHLKIERRLMFMPDVFFVFVFVFLAWFLCCNVFVRRFFLVVACIQVAHQTLCRWWMFLLALDFHL